MRKNSIICNYPGLALAITALFASINACATLVEKSIPVSDVDVQYMLVLPDGYDQALEYPAIIAFGGGQQTMGTVQSLLDRSLQQEAEQRGYIVIAPAAPDSELFFLGGDRIFPEFLDAMLRDYRVTDGKFHVVGVSNGGIAALHVAATNPDYFVSVTAFPGYMWQPNEQKLLAIAKMCVFMYVGELDRYRWHGEMKREAEFLQAQGAVAKYTVELGQPHGIETLRGANAGRLFDDFAATHQGCTNSPEDSSSPGSTGTSPSSRLMDFNIRPPF